MIPRYEIPEIREIFSDEGRFNTWLEVELAAAEAMAELGLVPAQAVRVCRERARIDPKRIGEIEEITRHDVIAFLEHLEETVGPEARHLHLGMTSSDVLDTALALQIARAHRVLLDDLEKLLGALREQALKYKDTICIGRSHGVHAEPTTFGLKLAVSYAQFKRDHERLSATAEGLRVGQISGAVGTYTSLSPEIEERTCAKLGLKPAPISTQILQRDRHAAYLSALAILGADLERLALEIRHLQRTEVAEAFEPFTKGQKGSSAMPHKRNPIVTERVAGMARLLRSNAHAAIENVALWHERDISHSSVERVIIPDGFHLAVYMLRKMLFVVRGLVVDSGRMAENLALTGGLTASSGLLVELIRAGLERKAAYELVQRHALAAWEGKGDFRTAIEKDPVVAGHLDRETIERCFGQKPRFIDVTYRRLGIIGE
ncbi:MAG: adenylosuccinate lyase [Candidatus Coatesbacteria bacterium RBG_13_66_14]|uniref:Adenylosuccinate lyase n=1 Tax=Candidatus Coatesbacteria bacterium RBG_13_66_14 TaxID=1817816 RepID=A0A1F5FAX1_9BACT|nr:MAG: adenylosuccinate lyase [Candidatus Coatesbacteria bacterium RBG_13_66_14]